MKNYKHTGEYHEKTIDNFDALLKNENFQGLDKLYLKKVYPVFSGHTEGLSAWCFDTKVRTNYALAWLIVKYSALPPGQEHQKYRQQYLTGFEDALNQERQFKKNWQIKLDQLTGLVDGGDNVESINWDSMLQDNGFKGAIQYKKQGEVLEKTHIERWKKDHRSKVQITDSIKLEGNSTYIKLKEQSAFKVTANQKEEIIAFLCRFKQSQNKEEFAKKELSNTSPLKVLPVGLQVDDLDRISNAKDLNVEGSIHWGDFLTNEHQLQKNVDKYIEEKSNKDALKANNSINSDVNQSGNKAISLTNKAIADNQITTLDKLKANKTYQALANQEVFTALAGDDKQLAIIEFLLNYALEPDSSLQTFAKDKLSPGQASLDNLPSYCSQNELDKLANVAGDLNEGSIN
ncbi:hypothetical protein N9Y17_04270 [Gammaproteobacteria bacterium]|nr:hypothetical protein [Gammaproteobacteria bacterium]